MTNISARGLVPRADLSDDEHAVLGALGAPPKGAFRDAKWRGAHKRPAPLPDSAEVARHAALKGSRSAERARLAMEGLGDLGALEEGPEGLWRLVKVCDCWDRHAGVGVSDLTPASYRSLDSTPSEEGLRAPGANTDEGPAIAEAGTAGARALTTHPQRHSNLAREFQQEHEGTPTSSGVRFVSKWAVGTERYNRAYVRWIVDMFARNAAAYNPGFAMTTVQCQRMRKVLNTWVSHHGMDPAVIEKMVTEFWLRVRTRRVIIRKTPWAVFTHRREELVASVSSRVYDEAAEIERYGL